MRVHQEAVEMSTDQQTGIGVQRDVPLAAAIRACVGHKLCQEGVDCAFGLQISIGH